MAASPVHLQKLLDALSLNPALPADLVRRLLRRRPGLAVIGRRSDLTDDMITEILDADDVLALCALAGNRHLPTDFRRQLIEHPDEAVRAAATSEPEQPARTELGYEPETLRRFATDADANARCLAPHDPDLPREITVWLARDPLPKVRQAVAAHQNLPTRWLIALLDDRFEAVAVAAAGSPHLPVAEMERLVALGEPFD